VNPRDIVRRYHKIAVVGASNDLVKPAGYVTAYLIERGLRVIPVNPTETEVQGEKSYPDLASVPEPVEVVDIFRRSEDVPPVVDDAIAIGAKAVWLQSGIVNHEAAAKAREAGLDVVQDRCIKTVLRHMIEDGEWEA
jgi:predicted CoA-binding protein